MITTPEQRAAWWAIRANFLQPVGMRMMVDKGKIADWIEIDKLASILDPVFADPAPDKAHGFQTIAHGQTPARQQRPALSPGLRCQRPAQTPPR